MFIPRRRRGLTGQHRQPVPKWPDAPRRTVPGALHHQRGGGAHLPDLPVSIWALCITFGQNCSQTDIVLLGWPHTLCCLIVFVCVGITMCMLGWLYVCWDEYIYVCSDDCMCWGDRVCWNDRAVHCHFWFGDYTWLCSGVTDCAQELFPLSLGGPYGMLD